MTIEISKEARAKAIASILRYAEENFDEPLGNLAAELLLNFLLDDIGPTIYNKAIADVQERMQTRVMELDIEMQKEEFQFWHDRRKRSK
jgi:uncharacterized protein (DUF2164 family)